MASADPDSPAKASLPAGPRPLPAGPPEWDSIPEALRKEMNISREDFEAIRARMSERESRVPSVGDPAPDFALRKLEPGGVLGDEVVRLGDLLDRPVALVFGSYT